MPFNVPRNATIKIQDAYKDRVYLPTMQGLVPLPTGSVQGTAPSNPSALLPPMPPLETVPMGQLPTRWTRAALMGELPTSTASQEMAPTSPLQKR
jgi:hypothetical protein